MIPNTSDCFVCNYEIQFKLLQILFPVKGFCKHSKHFKSSYPHYKVVKPYLLLSYIFLGLSLFPLLSFLFYVTEACENDKTICLVLIGDQIFAATSFFSSCINVIRVEVLAEEYNRWLHLSEFMKKINEHTIQKKHYNSGKRNVTTLKLFYNVIVPVVFSCIIFQLSLDNYPWSWSRKMYQVNTYIILYIMSIDLMAKLKFIGYAMDFIKNGLKKSLNNKKRKSLLYYRDSTSLLKNYCLLVTDIHKHLKAYMMFMALVFSIWTLLTIIFLILNIYIWIGFGRYGYRLVSFLHFKTTASILSTLAILFRAGKEFRKVS